MIPVNKKGLSFSVIPLIALIGVLGLSIWAGYQLSLGGSTGSITSDISEGDQAVQNLELVKNMLTQSLEFASIQASLDIARNGGTDTTTFWYCSLYPLLAPEPDEVESSMTRMINESLNAYVGTTRGEESPLFELEPDIPDYKCVGVFEPNNGDPANTNCYNQNSVNCEEFAVSAASDPDSIIEIHEPVYVNDDVELETNIENNRFYWLYYNLYNNFVINDYSQYFLPSAISGCGYYVLDGGSLVLLDDYIAQQWASISDCIDQDNNLRTDLPGNSDCPERYAEVLVNIQEANSNQIYGTTPATVRINIEDSLGEVCDLYDDVFASDGYVSCEGLIECFEEDDHPSCLASGCERGSFEDACDTAPVISLQGESEVVESDGSTRFRIEITDSKFKIPSGDLGVEPGEERQFQDLVWNIYGGIELEDMGCPILIVVGGAQQAGSQVPPTPSS